MSATVIPTGHALARKVFGAAVFSEMTRQPTFMNRLTGEAPDMGEVRSKLEKMETPRGYPVVRIMDLARSAGDSSSSPSMAMMSFSSSYSARVRRTAWAIR